MSTASIISTVTVTIGLALLGLGCESGATASAPGNAPVAAGNSPNTTAAPASAPAAAQPTASAMSAGARFGAAFEPGASVPLATLVSNPKAYEKQTVTTEGKVQRACSRKGCWMEIGAGEDAARVTFKDYGFFVPTDSAGAHAKVQGRLDTREVEAAAVDHLEAEGARFRNKKPDGSATEVRLIASAVELTR